MDIRLFSGSANPDLASCVARELRIPLGRRLLQRFPDGEVEFRLEQTVRGRDVYLLQSTGPPVNEHLMELLVMIDASRRAAAGRITALVPYYGYSRQEKKSRGREPITARLVADLMTVAGADRVVSIDLHAPAIQGFFNIGMDHLTAVPILIEHLRQHREPDMVVVSPDTGRAKLAEKYARALGLPLVVLHKQRLGGAETEIHAVVGDVRGRRPIIIDDMITTGGTIHNAVQALLQAGATPELTVAATHGLLVGKALERLADPVIAEVAITDTVPVPPEKRIPKMHVVSVDGLLAEAVRRLNEERSISEIFPPRYDHHPV
ncbi:MAG: ribose-phosphate diphosphokinase [Chloroflexota bacterium]